MALPISLALSGPEPLGCIRASFIGRATGKDALRLQTIDLEYHRAVLITHALFHKKWFGQAQGLPVVIVELACHPFSSHSSTKSASSMPAPDARRRLTTG